MHPPNSNPPKRTSGRPRKVTLERIEEAVRLRSEGLTWEGVGQRLGLKPETCRRAVWAVRKVRGAVGNPPGPVNNTPTEA
jgi:hypothetical protein